MTIVRNLDKKKKCPGCKCFRYINDFPTKFVNKLESKRCRKCQKWGKKSNKKTKEYRKEYNRKLKADPVRYKKHLEQLKKYQSILTRSPQIAYGQYKGNAKDRKIDFNLSIEDFMFFWKQPCFYCGDIVPTIGLDRINSDLGYKKNNLVSCCKICNYMKQRESLETFVKQCFKIVQKHKDALQ